MNMKTADYNTLNGLIENAGDRLELIHQESIRILQELNMRLTGQLEDGEIEDLHDSFLDLKNILKGIEFGIEDRPIDFVNIDKLIFDTMVNMSDAFKVLSDMADSREISEKTKAEVLAPLLAAAKCLNEIDNKLFPDGK